MKGRQQQLIIHLIHRQGFPIEMSDKEPQAFILPLFYDQQARRGTLMSLSPNKVINKQLAQLFERTYQIWGYFTEPDSCRTFEGGRESSTHNFIQDPLKVHCSLKSSNVIKQVTHSIIRIQGRHLEFQRQGVTIDGSREGGVYSVNQILYRICSSHVLPHLIHSLPHLVYLPLQVWHPS